MKHFPLVESLTFISAMTEHRGYDEDRLTREEILQTDVYKLASQMWDEISRRRRQIFREHYQGKRGCITYFLKEEEIANPMVEGPDQHHIPKEIFDQKPMSWYREYIQDNPLHEVTVSSFHGSVQDEEQSPRELSSKESSPKASIGRIPYGKTTYVKPDRRAVSDADPVIQKARAWRARKDAGIQVVVSSSDEYSNDELAPRRRSTYQAPRPPNPASTRNQRYEREAATSRVSPELILSHPSPRTRVPLERSSTSTLNQRFSTGTTSNKVNNELPFAQSVASTRAPLGRSSGLSHDKRYERANTTTKENVQPTLQPDSRSENTSRLHQRWLATKGVTARRASPDLPIAQPASSSQSVTSLHQQYLSEGGAATRKVNPDLQTARPATNSRWSRALDPPARVDSKKREDPEFSGRWASIKNFARKQGAKSVKPVIDNTTSSSEWNSSSIMDSTRLNIEPPNNISNNHKPKGKQPVQIPATKTSKRRRGEVDPKDISPTPVVYCIGENPFESAHKALPLETMGITKRGRTFKYRSRSFESIVADMDQEIKDKPLPSTPARTVAQCAPFRRATVASAAPSVEPNLRKPLFKGDPWATPTKSRVSKPAPPPVMEPAALVIRRSMVNAASTQEVGFSTAKETVSKPTHQQKNSVPATSYSTKPGGSSREYVAPTLESVVEKFAPKRASVAPTAEVSIMKTASHQRIMDSVTEPSVSQRDIIREYVTSMLGISWPKTASNRRIVDSAAEPSNSRPSSKREYLVKETQNSTSRPTSSRKSADLSAKESIAQPVTKREYAVPSAKDLISKFAPKREYLAPTTEDVVSKSAPKREYSAPTNPKKIHRTPSTESLVPFPEFDRNQAVPPDNPSDSDSMDSRRSSVCSGMSIGEVKADWEKIVDPRIRSIVKAATCEEDTLQNWLSQTQAAARRSASTASIDITINLSSVNWLSILTILMAIYCGLEIILASLFGKPLYDDQPHWTPNSPVFPYVLVSKIGDWCGLTGTGEGMAGAWRWYHWIFRDIVPGVVCAVDIIVFYSFIILIGCISYGWSRTLPGRANGSWWEAFGYVF